MRKSFTLIELIIVIVVLAIVGNITFDTIAKVYDGYFMSKEANKAQVDTTNALDFMSVMLRDRIKNSVIATKNDLSDFKQLQNGQGSDSNYTILEWIGKDYESRRGEWNDNLKKLQVGWSGFCDVDDAEKISSNPTELNVSLKDANFSIIQDIDGNITNNDNVFENNISAIIFAGSDYRGDVSSDYNKSYGWYKDNDNRQAQKVFAIVDYNQLNDGVNATIESINDTNDTTIFEDYYFVRTAYAIVPEKQSDGRYNLYFYDNYRPWNGDTFKDGNKSLLVSNVVSFSFKEENNLLRLFLCVSSDYKIDNDDNITICKERVLF